MDGGDADGCCDYTVDITFSVIEEPPSDLQVRIIDQFFDDPVFPDSSKLIQPVVPGGEEDIDCGITGGIGTVIETTITSTSKLDDTLNVFTVIGMNNFLVWTLQIIGSEIVTTTTTTTTTTLDFQDFKWRENGGEANFSLDGLDASCGFCTYTVNITWTVVQTGSITEVNIDGTLFQPPEFPDTEKFILPDVLGGDDSLECYIVGGGSDGIQTIISSTNFVNDTLDVFTLENGYGMPVLIWTLQITSSSTEGGRLRLRQLQDMFSCPDGCEIPMVYVNDNFCDCSDCADETSWTCDTCAAVDDDEDNPQESRDVGIGVGVGVGTALALGIGLGVGLGTGVGSGIGAGGAGSAGSAGSAGAMPNIAPPFAFFLMAKGRIRLNSKDPSLLTKPDFADALKETIARLSGGGVEAAMVELIINCADAMRRMLAENHLRRLQMSATVGVCFQVRVADSAAEEVCQTLSGLDANNVGSVLSEELVDAGIDPSAVSVVGYDAEPNPRSYSPLQQSDVMDGGVFVPPESVSLGRRLFRQFGNVGGVAVDRIQYP